jgi:hypothetical protein
VQCEDVSVAYMLAISSKIRRRGARKARPINPQSQRLWDVMQLDRSGLERMEPSYSANLAPLVTRARTLQRRLNALQPMVELKETSIANTLEAIRTTLKLPNSVRLEYRSFETGLENRREILERMVGKGWIKEDWDAELYDLVTRSVECFHAFLAAWVGALHHAGLTSTRPTGYVDGEGWVFLPEVVAKVDWPTAVFE